jgi:hypothetical protein
MAPGRDVALIQKIEALPSGNRNSILKEALQIGLELYLAQKAIEADSFTQVEQGLNAIQQALQDMPTWLDQRFALMHQAIQTTAVRPAQGADPIEVTTLNRLDPVAKARRTANMSKRNW